MLTNQGYYASSLWERPTYDDACEEAANEFGKILTGQAGENLLLSSNLSWTLEQLPAAQAITGPLWVQYEPETLTNAYQLQVACGATALVTETAGCTANLLDELDTNLSCYELCDKAARAAYAASPRFVVGAITSAKIPVLSQDSPAARQARALYKEQATALADAQVHALFITDMTTIEDALCAVLASRLVCSRPIICALDATAFTASYNKTELSRVFKRLVDAGAEAIGLTNVFVSGCAQSDVSAVLAASSHASIPPTAHTLAQDLVSIADLYGVGTLMTMCPSTADGSDDTSEQAFLQMAYHAAQVHMSIIGAGKGSALPHTAALSAGLLAM